MYSFYKQTNQKYGHMLELVFACLPAFMTCGVCRDVYHIFITFSTPPDLGLFLQALVPESNGQPHVFLLCKKATYPLDEKPGE